MYDSIANFGIWCTPQPSTSQALPTNPIDQSLPDQRIAVTESIPDFQDNMIRQRISIHGEIREMEPPSEMPALNMHPDKICVLHPGPTKRWLEVKRKWDVMYAKQKRHVQLAREREYAEAEERCFLGGDLGGEIPPPSALVGRPSVQLAIEESLYIRWICSCIYRSIYFQYLIRTL
jgi:hypothetical protein